MIVEQQNIIEVKSEVKSETTQNKIRHRYWLMLQFQFWMFNLFVAGLCLYLISQFAQVDIEANSVYNTTQYKYGTEAISMWKKGYIVDIKEVNTDNCPQGYKELINYYWPGTYEGCYCQAMVGNHASEYIMQGACSSELISLGCSSIPAMSKQNMKMWKGSKLLCYKRVQSLNFYNSTLAKTPNEGDPMKICALDKNYQVRTFPNVSCPETVISNTTVGTSSQTVLTLDQINLKKLFYENQQNYPIADFKLTQYNFCPYWNQLNISPDKNGNYILELTNFSSTCTGKDPRIVEFDYMTEEDFYTNNTRIYDMISSLPGYPRPSIAYYYRLGFIRYPAWTNLCRNSDSHNLLIATKHLQFDHITQKTKLIVYVGVPCLILVAVLARILYMIRHIFQIKAKKEYNMVVLTDQEIGQQIPNLNIIKSYKKQLFLFILELVLVVAALVVLCIGAYELINESAWIKQSFNRKCTQDHLNWIFRFIEDKVDNCGFIVGRSIMFVIVIMFAQVAHFTIRTKLGDLKQKELPPVQSLSNQGLIKDDLNEKSNMIMNENIHMQDSSDIILQKQKEELKVYDLDNFMGNDIQGGAGETGLNFYAQQSIQQQNFQVAKKKKKKGLKRKNLFKEGDEK